MVAIYARQSIDKKDSISIETQIDICKRSIYDEPYEVFYDKGYSGSNTDRPEFTRMMEKVKQGDITKIIVYKLDRITRSMRDFLNIKDLLDKYNVSFESVNDNYDTSTPSGRAQVNMLMVFAQLERENTQDRITDNYLARAKNGMFLGGPTPFGFSKEPIKSPHGKATSHLVPSEYADVVCDMFNMYAETDCSLNDIAKHLVKLGIQPPKGNGWDSNRVGMILRNPIYVKANAYIYAYYKDKGCQVLNQVEDFAGTNGCVIHGKRKGSERKYTDLSNHKLSLSLHEGLVSSEIFLICQRKLDANRQIGNSGKGSYT